MTSCVRDEKEIALSLEDATYLYERIKELELEEIEGGYDGCLGTITFLMSDDTEKVYTIYTDEAIGYEDKTYRYDDSELYDKAHDLVYSEEINYVPYQEETYVSHIASALLDSVITTVNTNEVNISIKDGKITFVTKDGEDLGDLTGLSGVLGVSWKTDCGGSDHLVALSDDGKARCFDFYYGYPSSEYEEPVYYISDLVTIEFDEKIVDIGIYDDTTPFTTCGGEEFYYTLENGDIVNSAGLKREEAHPYEELMSYGDMNEYSKESAYIFFFDNGDGQTIKRALVDRDDYVIGEMTPLMCDGKDIIAKKQGSYLSDDTLYVIGLSDELYVYDLITDKCEVYEDAAVSEYAIEGKMRVYPDRVEIKCSEAEFTLEDGIQKTKGPSVFFAQKQFQ